jgi:hypothetical protein
MGYNSSKKNHLKNKRRKMANAKERKKVEGKATKKKA